MAEKKADRWGEIHAETPEGQELVRFLRRLLREANKGVRDLDTGYGKTTVAEYCNGKRTPPKAFVEQAVIQCTTTRERESAMRAALRLWAAADHPTAPVSPAPLPASDAQTTAEPTTASLASLAATAQGQAAQAQEQLARAQDRNDALAQERDKFQQLVVALSGLSADLRRQVDELRGSRDLAAEERLTELTEQLQTAQRDLQRARAGRNEAELLTQRLRRRSDELEEQLAELSQTRSAASVTGSFDMSSMPEEFKEALFRSDADRVLAAAQSFLDEGQVMRDQVRDEWGIKRPLHTTALERWRTAAHVLGRALGCMAMMAGAVGHLALSDAGVGGWVFLLDMLALAGLVLMADPWEVAAHLWPALRNVMRQEPLTAPIRVSAQEVTRCLVRCLSASLAAAGAVLILATATRWSSWWLLPLFPVTVVCAVYAVVGDRRVLPLLQEALGYLAAELQMPRPQMPPIAVGRRPVIALADPRWLEDRRRELGSALAGSWKDAALWVKAAVVIAAGLLVLGVIGALSSAITHSSIARSARESWNGSGLVAAIDNPVRHYLAGHTLGLPVPADTVHLVWLASGAGLLLVSFVSGSFGARLTWVMWGAATVVMVWAGTTGPARQVAAALALIGWGIASILALRGLGRRSVPAVSNNVTVTND